MGFIRDLFRKKNTSNTDETPAEKNKYVLQLFELIEYMDSLLQADKYIAKSEYRNRIEKYQEVIDFFTVLKNSDMLIPFCQKNGIQEAYMEQAEKKILFFDQYMDQHNDNFIKKAMVEEKEYLDNILKSVDPQIILDEDQRRVILTDEDYCLVIAGAGACKTTTVAAKVKYLVERNHVDPSQILVVSFTNKAVNELKEKINEELQIECPIATFHSTGNAIIHKNEPDNTLTYCEIFFWFCQKPPPPQPPDKLFLFLQLSPLRILHLRSCRLSWKDRSVIILYFCSMDSNSLSRFS